MNLKKVADLSLPDTITSSTRRSPLGAAGILSDVDRLDDHDRGGLSERLRTRRRNLARSPASLVLAWLIVLPLSLWAITRSFGLERGFPGSPLIALTPYVAALSPLAVLSALILGRRSAALVAGLAAVALFAAVLPRTIAADAPTGAGPTLRVMSANLLEGGADIDQLADRVEREGVELLSVQELTPLAARRIEASAIGELLPFDVADSLPDSAGIGLYASVPLRGRRARFDGNRPTIRATLEPPGAARVQAFAIHPLPPTGPAAVQSLERYLDSIPAADPAGPPSILLGDFNATLDNSGFRALLDRGYEDVADELGSGLTPTWPGDWWPPPVTIDHVLIDDRLGATAYDVLPQDGSDHDAVLATLVLPAASRGGRGDGP